MKLRRPPSNRRAACSSWIEVMSPRSKVEVLAPNRGRTPVRAAGAKLAGAAHGAPSPTANFLPGGSNLFKNVSAGATFLTKKGPIGVRGENKAANSYPAHPHGPDGRGIQVNCSLTLPRSSHSRLAPGFAFPMRGTGFKGLERGLLVKTGPACAVPESWRGPETSGGHEGRPLP